MTIRHVVGYAPTWPGNDEADALARVRWLQRSPPTDLAAWLHHRLQHAGVKTMWRVVQQSSLPLMLDVLVEACQACVVCAQEYPHPNALEPWMAR